MKYTTFLISFMMVFFTACSKDDHTVPDWGGGNGDSDVPDTPVLDDELSEPFAWEAARTAKLDYTDMVLFYGGGRQRYIENWDNDRLSSYVTYTDEFGQEKWFFDSFLFLEFADYGAGSAMVSYATGYKDPNGNMLNSASKADWERLINYYFRDGHNLAALDETVGNAIKRLGQPKHKRCVVITVPEPITRYNSSKPTSATDYWGKIGDKKLDFARDADRLEAVQWYINRVRQLWDKAKFENIELAGFYWISEKATNSATVLPKVSTYLDKFNYTFNWIPFFTADGYAQWERWGFDYAYLQPNYFFQDNIPVSRLTEACSMGAAAKMGMEMEFDDNALASNGKGYKLRNYMQAFKDNMVWHNSRLAYYQGNNTVHTLLKSSNAEDKKLFHEFATFVTTRPYRDGK